jgi:hypothetical protein
MQVYEICAFLHLLFREREISPNEALGQEFLDGSDEPGRRVALDQHEIGAGLLHPLAPLTIVYKDQAADVRASDLDLACCEWDRLARQTVIEYHQGWSMLVDNLQGQRTLGCDQDLDTRQDR